MISGKDAEIRLKELTQSKKKNVKKFKFSLEKQRKKISFKRYIKSQKYQSSPLEYFYLYKQNTKLKIKKEFERKLKSLDFDNDVETEDEEEIRLARRSNNQDIREALGKFMKKRNKSFNLRNN